jgi:hypothetical protein
MSEKFPHCGNAIAAYFEGSTLVGQRTMYCCGYAPSEDVHISAFWPHTAYFCPVCGEIWGRLIMNYQFQYSPSPNLAGTSWAVESRRCAAHGDGQFLTGFREARDLQHCSTDLLRREYFVLSQGLPPQAAVQQQDSPTQPKAQLLVSARARFQTQAA